MSTLSTLLKTAAFGTIIALATTNASADGWGVNARIHIAQQALDGLNNPLLVQLTPATKGAQFGTPWDNCRSVTVFLRPPKQNILQRTISKLRGSRTSTSGAYLKNINLVKQMNQTTVSVSVLGGRTHPEQTRCQFAAQDFGVSDRDGAKLGIDLY